MHAGSSISLMTKLSRPIYSQAPKAKRLRRSTRVIGTLLHEIKESELVDALRSGHTSASIEKFQVSMR